MWAWWYVIALVAAIGFGFVGEWFSPGRDTDGLGVGLALLAVAAVSGCRLAGVI